MRLWKGPGAKALTVMRLAGELDRQRAGQMMHRGLRRRVGIGVVGERLRAHHRAEIDDARRIVVARRVGQQRHAARASGGTGR